MKRVLLTGASGFIGRHCLGPLLKRNYEIHAVDIHAVEKTSPEISWHSGDLLNANQVKLVIDKVKPTHLLHFAWFTKYGEYWSSLYNLQWVQASIELVQQFWKHGGKRAVIAGTCAEYDWQYGYCSEQTTPLAPQTLYGTCKDSLHRIIEVFSQQTGLSFAWGRVFFLYGPHEHPGRLIPSVINALLKGESALCSHGQQLRDFLYVEDVAEAFVTLLDSDITGPVNIASGSPISLKKIIFDIAEKLSRPDLIQLGAIAPQPNEPRVLFADTSRLFNEVCWTPLYSLEQGLDCTMEWWKKRGNWKAL
jgi:nucleoside-diphosphate-sugar epimerase